jgi:hypothetical protein
MEDLLLMLMSYSIDCIFICSCYNCCWQAANAKELAFLSSSVKSYSAQDLPVMLLSAEIRLLH